jgi:gliding motility-associated-like protein
MKLKTRIAFFLLCTTVTATLAQSPYQSRDGFFNVDEVRGCAPLTVNVTIPTSATSCPCEFFYEGQPFQNRFNYTYSTPGTYTLIVLFQNPPDPSDPTKNTDRITITVLPDTPPPFEIYSCEGNSVQVNITDTNTDFTGFDINWGDGTPVTREDRPIAPVSKTYLTPGTKTISVEGRSTIVTPGKTIYDAGTCTPATQQIVPINTFVPPTIDLLTVTSSQEIELDFDLDGKILPAQNQDNIQFRLQIATDGASSFTNRQNVYQSTTATISGLQTDNHYYCFRLAAYDPCDNSIGYYSNVICSSNFDVTAVNNANRLDWRTSPAGVSNYSFTKNGTAGLTAAAAASTLNDTNVICGRDYCYQQTTNYVGGARSISLIKCDTAKSTTIPTVAENISSVVGPDNKTVRLQWTQDPAFNAVGYAVTKSVNGAFAVQRSSTTTNYTDSAYVNDVVSCYRISYRDACNNQSPLSRDACPIKLLASQEPNNNAINLSWSAYDGWKNGVNRYIIEKFNDQGQLLATINAGTALTYVDNTQDLLNQVVVYRITAISNEAGITSSVSNTFIIIKEPNLFYPTAFTPNSDGLNDIFSVFGHFITTFEMKIFNRWGEMMFVTDDLEKGWDGTYNGSAVPEGTYVFRATLTDQAGRTFDRSGTVLLLKKR